MFRRYQKVKEFWYSTENNAIEIVKLKSDRTAILGTNLISWAMNGNNLLCRLPSGRYLTYPEATLDYTETPWGDTKLTLFYMAQDSKNRWSKEKTYGGKLVENITQAVARDILAQAMLRLERRGFPVIFSVHDEVVCEVPEKTHDLDTYRQLLCELPEWAKDLPLKAECWKGKRYRKE